MLQIAKKRTNIEEKLRKYVTTQEKSMQCPVDKMLDAPLQCKTVLWGNITPNSEEMAVKIPRECEIPPSQWYMLEMGPTRREMFRKWKEEKMKELDQFERIIEHYEQLAQGNVTVPCKKNAQKRRNKLQKRLQKYVLKKDAEAQTEEEVHTDFTQGEESSDTEGGSFLEGSSIYYSAEGNKGDSDMQMKTLEEDTDAKDRTWQQPTAPPPCPLPSPCSPPPTHSSASPPVPSACPPTSSSSGSPPIRPPPRHFLLFCFITILVLLFFFVLALSRYLLIEGGIN